LADPPRVVLIGDSIRLEYQPLVAARLGASAEVAGPAGNCGDSGNVLRRLGDWVGPGTTLVVFNAGLHDLLRSGKGGRRQVEIDRYEANLAGIVRDLRAKGVSMLFATTTPVDDRRHAASGKPERLDDDVRSYNAAARRVMDELEVPVVDLYPLVGPALLGGDGVHLTAEGYAAVAAVVTEKIADLL
jgi:lysophospholipase L1-like esterase